jgi:hypothetical protein
MGRKPPNYSHRAFAPATVWVAERSSRLGAVCWVFDEVDRVVYRDATQRCDMVRYDSRWRRLHPPERLEELDPPIQQGTTLIIFPRMKKFVVGQDALRPFIVLHEPTLGWAGSW